MITAEEIKKRKLQEYLAAQQSSNYQQQMFEHQQQSRQLEEMKLQLKAVMSQIMAKEALQRLSILRTTRPEFAMQAELMLLELYRQGKIKPPVSDSQLKTILSQAIEPKKETKIKRR